MHFLFIKLFLKANMVNVSLMFLDWVTRAFVWCWPSHASNGPMAYSIFFIIFSCLYVILNIIYKYKAALYHS